MWLSELNEFETSYQKYIEQRNARQKGVAVKRVVKRQKKVKKAKKVKKLSKKIKLVAS